MCEEEQEVRGAKNGGRLMKKPHGAYLLQTWEREREKEGERERCFYHAFTVSNSQ